MQDLYMIKQKKKNVIFFDKVKREFKVNNKIFKVNSDLELNKKYKKRQIKIIITIGNNEIRKNYFNNLKKIILNFQL